MINKTNLHRKKKAILSIVMMVFGVICQILGVLYPPNFCMSYEIGRSYIPYEMRGIGVITAIMGIISLVGGIIYMPARRLNRRLRVVLAIVATIISIMWVVCGIGYLWVTAYA